MRGARYYERKLEREREKLGRLLDATMDEPIALNKAVLEQSQRVDELVVRLQKMRKGDFPGEREHGG